MVDGETTEAALSKDFIVVFGEHTSRRLWAQAVGIN